MFKLPRKSSRRRNAQADESQMSALKYIYKYTHNTKALFYTVQITKKTLEILLKIAYSKITENDSQSCPLRNIVSTYLEQKKSHSLNLAKLTFGGDIFLFCNDVNEIRSKNERFTILHVVQGSDYKRYFCFTFFFARCKFVRRGPLEGSPILNFLSFFSSCKKHQNVTLFIVPRNTYTLATSQKEGLGHTNRK